MSNQAFAIVFGAAAITVALVAGIVIWALCVAWNNRAAVVRCVNRNVRKLLSRRNGPAPVSNSDVPTLQPRKTW